MAKNSYSRVIDKMHASIYACRHVSKLARGSARTSTRTYDAQNKSCSTVCKTHLIWTHTCSPAPALEYSIPQAVALILHVHSISNQGGRPFCFVWTSGWKRRVKRGVLCENRQPRCLGRVKLETRASASAAPAGVRSSARLNTTSRTSRIPVHSARELTVLLVPWRRSRDVSCSGLDTAAGPRGCVPALAVGLAGAAV